MKNRTLKLNEDIIQFFPLFLSDHRGSLLKSYSQEDFLSRGIHFSPVEETFLKSNQNVLRGLHFSKTLKQSKLITCISGKVQLVAVNVDKKSSSLGNWFSYELTENVVIYIPGHYAIGTYAFEDTLFHLGYGEKFMTENNAGIRWNDSYIGIEWELKDEKPIIAAKDLRLPLFKEMC